MDKYMEKETKRESYRKPQNNKIDELMNEWINEACFMVCMVDEWWFYYNNKWLNGLLFCFFRIYRYIE